jgi:predicted nucleic acid-binding protein
MKHKIIVDTSIWIEYFKNTLINSKFIEKGLNEEFVYITGPIISELLQGVRTQKEYIMLSQSIGAVPFLNCHYNDWITAGNISFSLRKKGIIIPLSDIIIAAVAIRNDAKIYTLDKHFKQIPAVDLYYS